MLVGCREKRFGERILGESGVDRQCGILAGISVRAYASLDEFANSILPDSGALRHGFAVAINPEKIMTARRDPDTRAVLESATIRYADGAGVVWALGRKGIHAPRLTGADLWERLMARASAMGVTVSLLGASPEVLDRTVARLRQDFPGIKIGAAMHGYVDEASRLEFARAVRDQGGGIVAVAMGSPRQEKVIRTLREICPDAFYMGVGGTFDCFTGEVRRAPLAWQRLNLEWLYRLLRQPHRIKRQWKLVPYVALVLSGKV